LEGLKRAAGEIACMRSGLRKPRLLETPMQRALNVIEGLDEEEQALLLDFIHQRRIESRRAEIAENARATTLAFREGSARLGTIEDLRRDLTSEP